MYVNYCAEKIMKFTIQISYHNTNHTPLENGNYEGRVFHVYSTHIAPLENRNYKGRGATKRRCYGFVFPYICHTNHPLENGNFEGRGTTKGKSMNLIFHNIYVTQITSLQNGHYECKGTTERRNMNLLFHTYPTQITRLENGE